jgi:predicted ester cyclase
MKYVLPLLALMGVMSSCESGKDDAEAKNIESLKRFYAEVVNAHNPAALDSFVTPDFIDHQLYEPYEQGLEGLRKAFEDWFIGFPDVRITPQFFMASGDTVMALVRMTGTNTGPMMGMPPTNKSFDVQGVDILVAKDGIASEHWGFAEEMRMMMQMGMMPEMGAPADTMGMMADTMAHE